MTNRRPTDRDHEPDAAEPGIPQVTEQKCGHQADDRRGGREPTRRPSTNESATATTQTAAGAAKGNRRRASSGRTTRGIAGTANHLGIVGPVGAPYLSAVSSAISIAAITIARSNPYLRRSSPRLILAPTAYTGLVASAGFTVLDLAMLFTTWTAVRMILAGRYAEHRRWMIRSFSLIMAGVMLRVWSPIYDGLAAVGIVDFSFETAYAAIRVAVLGPESAARDLVHPPPSRSRGCGVS